MDINPSTVIAFIALIITIVSSVSGALFQFANRANKKYAAERNFDHLKNNTKQLAENIHVLSTEQEKRFDILERDILEIKVYLGLTTLSDRTRNDD